MSDFKTTVLSAVSHHELIIAMHTEETAGITAEVQKSRG